jgi:ubiquitin carboxyl-terminal hydrolase 47
LSDSDRTLVDDLSVMSTSNSPICATATENGGLTVDDFMLNLKKVYFKATYLYDDGSKCNNSGSIDSGNEDDTVSSSSDSQQKILRILTDKDMSIGKLKEYLQPYVRVPMEYFKLFHVNLSQTETEITKLTDTLNNTFKDAERVSIELGRVLRKGEYKTKLYYLNLNEITDEIEKIPFICEYIVRHDADVATTKREILAHITQMDKKYEHLTFERLRMRKKNWRCPTKILVDHQKFGDDILLSSTTASELIIQEVPENANVDSTGQPIDDDCKVFFVRQFFPSKMEMGKFNEVVIGAKGELKKILSEMSGIPVENIAYVKYNGNFPRYGLSVMQMQAQSWFRNPTTLDDNPIDTATDGNIFFFKDVTEPVKELTIEEKSEITRKENARLGTSSTSTTYSPRRERALKIYLDSPKKKDA